MPRTEKRGRRHSSEIVVARVDQQPISERVSKSDVRVDTFRATGPGGQHRNKTDSGVRLTHRPTGTVVTATESRSQHENRAVAWSRLADALAEAARGRLLANANGQRRSAFQESRSFTWTAWRDEVKGPGVRATMSAALNGRLDPLL